MLAVQQTITGGINEGRLMQHLQHFFSTSHTVLAELMQNARRAGASHVAFTLEDGNLVVTDDGSGVADFRALLTLAESAWPDEIQTEEHPYGIGFLSVCFAADTVLVESRGKQVRFSSADLQGKKPLAVTVSGLAAGTRITLENFRFPAAKVKGKLGYYAMGFPIPVVWQGEELERPFAMFQSRPEWTDTPVGRISAVGIHWHSKYSPCMFSDRCRTFLQGLPIRLHEEEDFRTYGEQNIVHLDSHAVQARSGS
jgi:hypothetical protein